MYCVYKISNGDVTYYGSTNNFKRRMKDHRQCCNSEKSKLYNKKKYKIIRENGGWDEFTKEIIENNIDTQVKVRQREDYWIRNNECINQNNATRTDQEKQAYSKQYRDDPINKVRYKAFQKVWYQVPINKARKKAYEQLPSTKAKKQVYRDNPINKARKTAYDKLPSTKARKKAYDLLPSTIARKKEKVQCECGSIGRRDTMNSTKHLTTQKHIKGVVKNLLDEYINQVLEIV